MKLIAQKSDLAGTVQIPGSKSHTIRAVAIGSLAMGKSLIHMPLSSSDTLSAVKCYQSLGAKIDTSNNDIWVVQGTGGDLQSPSETIDVGNSGTTLRITAGSAALATGKNPINMTGDEQICSRPIGPLLDSLNDLGANCSSKNNDGKAPISIGGTLTGGKTSIHAYTSQYLSSLLMACPLALGDSEIDVTLLNEPGYVQMTLDWLDKQGIDYVNHQFGKFVIKGNQIYKGFNEAIPADFSSATFFLCAAAISGQDVTLQGLDFSDSQPDKAVVQYLIQMGAAIDISQDSVTVKASPLKGITIDMNHTPDALPAMAVTAIFAETPTKLINVPQARSKETDRIACIAEELGKMGIKTEELDDGLIIYPGKPSAAKLDGRSDHRIVMALSIAGMNTEGTTIIDTAEAINVTFPEYVNLMGKLDANICLED